ncbi:Uncharacterized membrane protein YuzA, DUF378 family [Hathewaya proteolytica DSM 3090]|uniref:Uncharacterized membrane protein YuzA, DUF378 family n=1 Tax=Hathewaya proteolytica DSM 3090 TaxID=1121331 RepID=A0A1M6J2N1_9CLOT|nr:DUF378 domain-containing protein [Hathewaya proteolytica]SHJ40929.1 Uncharacterized membrane protein YuzA, DUF378 family [Hathewaya proteolytica DSM 3090]
MFKLKTIDKISIVLVLIGAVIWGLYGVVGVNIVDALFKAVPFISRTIYTIVGLAGLNLIFFILKTQTE